MGAAVRTAALLIYVAHLRKVSSAPQSPRPRGWNQNIKLFWVMAVMLMPPTLAASVYGMNFRHMPELEWTWGYPLALGPMILSGFFPYSYFKAKRWL